MTADYKRTEYFIFDLDGTLADTLDDITAAMNAAFSKLGLPPVTREKVYNSVNNGARMLVKRCLPEELRENADFVDRALSVYDREYSERYDVMTDIFPAAGEGLALLRKKGAKIGVLSNKQDPMVNGIVRSHLGGLVDFALGTGAGFPPKPAPEGALRVAERIGAGRGQTVTLVGDSDVDMELAANAGMQPVGVSWGYRSPDLLTKTGALMILDCAADFEKII